MVKIEKSEIKPHSRQTATNVQLPLEFKKHKALRLMNKPMQLTLTAVLQALAAAGIEYHTSASTRSIVLNAGDYNPLPDEMNAILANNQDLAQSDYTKLRQNTHPLWLLKTLPNMPASHLAIFTKSTGPSYTVATSQQAETLAQDLLLSNEAKTVICADLTSASAQIFTI